MSEKEVICTESSQRTKGAVKGLAAAQLETKKGRERSNIKEMVKCGLRVSAWGRTGCAGAPNLTDIGESSGGMRHKTSR